MKTRSIILSVATLAALGGFAATLQAANLPTIKVLATGGTIAGAQASATDYGYKSGAYDVNSLLSAVPNLDKLAVITGEQVANIGSQDMNDEVWLKLAKRVNAVLAESGTDGVLITHGTDTLEETAYLLDLWHAGPETIVVSGAVWSSTVHVQVAGSASTSRLGFVARTSKVCSPASRFVYSTPDVQNVSGMPSNEHWNSAAVSSATKVKLAVVAVVVTAGPVRIVTTGGVMSPLAQAYSAGVRSTEPSRAFARTSNSCRLTCWASSMDKLASKSREFSVDRGGKSLPVKLAKSWSAREVSAGAPASTWILPVSVSCRRAEDTMCSVIR